MARRRGICTDCNRRGPLSQCGVCMECRALAHQEGIGELCDGESPAALRHGQWVPGPNGIRHWQPATAPTRADIERSAASLMARVDAALERTLL